MWLKSIKHIVAVLMLITPHAGFSSFFQFNRALTNCDASLAIAELKASDPQTAMTPVEILAIHLVLWRQGWGKRVCMGEHVDFITMCSLNMRLPTADKAAPVSAIRLALETTEALCWSWSTRPVWPVSILTVDVASIQDMLQAMANALKQANAAQLALHSKFAGQVKSLKGLLTKAVKAIDFDSQLHWHCQVSAVRARGQSSVLAWAVERLESTANGLGGTDG